MNCAYDHASFHVRRGPREGYMNFRFQVTEMIEWGVNQNPKNPWGLQQTLPPPPPLHPRKKFLDQNIHAKFSEPLKFAPRKQLLNNIIQRMKTLEIEC